MENEREQDKSIVRLETKFEGMHDSLLEIKSLIEQTLKEQRITNGRISTLEAWRTYIVAGAGLLVTLFFVLVTPVHRALKKNLTTDVQLIVEEKNVELKKEILQELEIALSQYDFELVD